MLKKRYFISGIPIIIITILLLITLVFNNSIVLSYTFNNLDHYDKKLISENDVLRLISKCYYVNHNTAVFSSLALDKFKPDIYQLYWITNIIAQLKIDNNINLSIKDLSNLKDFTYLSDIKKESELNEIRALTGIFCNLGIVDYDKQILEKLLLSHYNKQDKLFFLRDSDEKIENKLVATEIALEIIKNMRMNFDQINEIKRKIINLYNDDTFFISTVESINNDGGVIIEILKTLDIKYTDINDNSSKRKNWVISINNTIYNNISNDFYSIITLDKLFQINYFFGNTFIVKSSYLDNYFKNYNSIYGYGYGKDAFNLEPQLVSIIYKLCTENNYKYPFTDQLKNYVFDSINSDFKKAGNIIPNVKDNYFGIVLANRFGFKYDKEKVVKKLKNSFTTYIENTNVNDHEKIVSLYYLILSLKETGIMVSKNDIKEIQNSVYNYIMNFNTISEENVIICVEDIRMCLDIMALFNTNLPKKIEEKVDSLAKKIGQSNILYNTIYITDLYQVYKYIDSQSIDTNFIKNIESSLSQLSVNGGYKVKISKNENGEADIISTYNGIKLKKDLFGISSTEKEAIKNLLYNLKDDNILKLAKHSNRNDLSTIYYGCLVSEIY